MTSRPILAVEDDAPHILIIDDDNRIRALLQRYLSENGYRVSTAENAAAARARLASLEFDLLIVDVMMPGENGLDLTRSLRATHTVPILMLTAQGDVDARIKGLESGADDYLGKPFEPRELLLRINNIFRRSATPPREAEPARETIKFGNFIFHIARGELRQDDEVVRLSEREREILRMLVEVPGEIVDRYTLAGPATDTSNDRTVDVQINRLRRKIEKDPGNPVHLQTVRGAGYRLVVEL